MHTRSSTDRPLRQPRPRLRGPWLLVAALGCASAPPVGDPANTLTRAPIDPGAIRWPSGYQPQYAGFFVHNEIAVKAPPEAVWDVLLGAETWPAWYEGATSVQVSGAPDRRLHPGAAFTWRTMGLDFTSTVTEFQAPHRLSWESRKAAIKGYHAWLIVPTADGCKVVTEESQHGFLTFMQRVFLPKKLHRLHDIWLAELKKKAEARARPQRQPRGGLGP